jgi:hypothetical protein
MMWRKEMGKAFYLIDRHPYLYYQEKEGETRIGHL